MRHVDHHSIEADCAHTGVLRKDGDYAFGVRDFFFGRCKSLVDNRRLRGMNSDLANESSLAIAQAILLKPLIVSEVGDQHTDRLHVDGAASGEAEALHLLIDVVVIAVGATVVAGTERGRQIFRPPSHTDQPVADPVEIGVKGQDRRRGLRRDTKNFGRALLDPFRRFQR